MATAPQIPAFDIVIVGAGVAGALLAWRLGGAGLNVALIEAGDAEVDRPAAVSAYAASPTKALGSPYSGAAQGPEHPGPLDAYYDLSGSPERYVSTYERISGGSTWHWLGHTPRLLPNDFRLKSAYGVGVDWPIGYDDLEPWYCTAENVLGVAGDDEQWANVHGAVRSRPFPMPPIWLSWSDTYVAQRINGRTVDGAEVAVLATPAARNSRPYDGRPPCAGNASCIPICPIGAKYDGSVHVRKALATGRVRLIANAVATGMTLAPEGRIDGIKYRLPGGTTETIQGRIVVLCANAIETAKLLLLAAGPAAPNGIANSSGQVGRNLMDHIQKSVFITTPDPVYPFRGPPSTAGIETFRDGEFRRERAAMRFSLNNDGWLRAPKSSPVADVALAVQDGLFGHALKSRLFAAISRQLRISLSTELLPDPDNRVTLSTLTDADGLPRPKINFRVGDYTHAAMTRALDVIRQLNGLIGGDEMSPDEDPAHWNGAGHVMGTCRMGATAKEAVADRNCRSFDHPNLYIVGASLWPTGGTANPTLTVAALSLRAAEHIAVSELGTGLGPFQ